MENGHSLKRGILYARVSTKAQAEEDHYSIPQQLHALREYCEREGYTIIEEVVDPGYSGASLQRPGLDRVRDLVESGGVSVVLAQDRDRFAREPAYLHILREEFAARGSSLGALNDHGHGTPEGQLADGIMDQIAKFERVKFAERSRRGLAQKVRQGKVVVTGKPTYGYRLTHDDRLEVREDQMEVLRRILAAAADGVSVYAIAKELTAEGVPTPTGLAVWSKASVWFLINADLYKPRPFEEIAALISPDVATTLDPERTYGLWAFNKRRTKTWNEPDGSGDYRPRYSYETRSPDEVLYTPVPDCGLDRDTVERAQRNVKSRARKPSGAARRFWELSGGIARCAECGSVLSPHTVISGDGHRRENYYYSCRSRYNDTAKSCENRHSNRAADLEALVWDRVCTLVDDEEEIRRIFDESITYLRRSASAENRAQLTERLAALYRKRSNYQDMAADGLVDRDELRTKLAAIEEQRDVVGRKLTLIPKDAHLAKELEKTRDMLILGVRRGWYSHIKNPQDRAAIYRRMGLVVTVDGDGNADLSGNLVPDEPFVGGDSTTPPASRRKSPRPR